MINYYIDFLEKTRNDLQSDGEVMIVKRVIENIADIFVLNIETLAQISYSSPTTIIRFVKRLGFKSYTDFRQKLSSSYQQFIISEPERRYTFLNDFTETNIEYFYNMSIEALKKTYENIDLNYLNKIVDKLINASSVVIIGNCYSMEIFYLLQITLNMYNIPCFIFKQNKILKDYLTMIDDKSIILYIDTPHFFKENFVCNDSIETIDLKTVKFNDLDDLECYRIFLSLQFIEEIIVYFVSNRLVGKSHGK